MAFVSRISITFIHASTVATAGPQRLPDSWGNFATFKEAKDAAKQQDRALLVYLHCSTHSDTGTFVQDVLGHEVVDEFLRDAFVLWAGDVSEAEGYRLSFVMQAQTFPFLGLLAASNGQVMMRIVGQVSREMLVTSLAQVLDNVQAVHVESKQRADSFDASRQIIQEQNAEYAEAEKRDRARLQESKRLQQEQRDREATQAAAEQAYVSKKEQLEHERDEFQALNLSKLPLDEPSEAAGDAGVCTVMFKLPGGATLTRNFVQDAPDSVSALYRFVYSCDELYQGCAFDVDDTEEEEEEEGKRRLQLPATFIPTVRLITGFPRAVVHDELDATIADLRLGSKFKLIVEQVFD
jgi:hypothetical protein